MKIKRRNPHGGQTLGLRRSNTMEQFDALLAVASKDGAYLHAAPVRSTPNETTPSDPSPHDRRDAKIDIPKRTLQDHSLSPVEEENISTNALAEKGLNTETSWALLYVSRFENKHDNAPKAGWITWKQLCKRLSQRHLTDDDNEKAKDGPLISGASYPETVWRRKGKTKSEVLDSANQTPLDWRAPIRCEDYVESVSIAILDFDSGMTREEIEEGVFRLNSGNGCAAFLYTTFSHNPDVGDLKYRLLLPLLRPVEARDWPAVWRRLAAHFNGAPDTNAKDASRMHYLPRCPKAREHFAVALELAGDPLAVATLPELSLAPQQLSDSAPLRVGRDTYAHKAFEAEIGRLCAATGNRNQALNDTARRLGQFIGAGRLDRSEVEGALMRAANGNGYMAKDGEGVARTTMKSGLDAGEREPNCKGKPTEMRRAIISSKDFPFAPRDSHNDDAPNITLGFRATDTGNGERFAAMFGQKIRFARGLGWLIWTGTHWEIDECDHVFELGKVTARSIYQEAGASEGEDERKRLASHAKASESAPRRAAMLDMAAKDCRTIKAKAGDFDKREQSGWLFNCQNGTLDLRTGELVPHDKSQNITRLAHVVFDPNATCPQFERFLMAVLGSDRALFDFVQKFIGYTLMGQTREQCLAILHGNGCNGKSTLLELLARLMGPYAKPADASLLMEKQAGKVSNDLAALRGVRMVLAAETKEGRAFDEELVKRLTGDDVITARFLYKEYFDFTPDFKIWLCTNHQPKIIGDDDGIWRRIRLIPFEVKFWDAAKGETGQPELQADKTLPDKLTSELSGILNWAAEGAMMWQRDGLGVPQAVADATGAYRSSQDPITSFLESSTVRDKNTSVSSSVLYRAFCDWSDGDSEPMSQTAFSTRLQNRGISSKRTMNGKRFLGISLATVHLGEDGRPIWGTNEPETTDFCSKIPKK